MWSSEIAATMFVPVNTVKTDIRGILRKAGRGPPNEAVRRAREMALV
jgi:LuxR family transcriptional regulator, maltose regulon positive regulatory protein